MVFYVRSDGQLRPSEKTSTISYKKSDLNYPDVLCRFSGVNSAVRTVVSYPISVAVTEPKIWRGDTESL